MSGQDQSSLFCDIELSFYIDILDSQAMVLFVVLHVQVRRTHTIDNSSALFTLIDLPNCEDVGELDV